MALVKRKHLNLYKKYITQIITDLGKILTAVMGEKEVRCNNCRYDEIHKCSSGIYNGIGPQEFEGGICPVCGGKGTILTVVKKNITATIKFVNQTEDDKGFVKEKFGVDRYSYLKVKTKVESYDDLNNAEYFLYDGERYKKMHLIKRGMKENVVAVAYLERENV